MNRGCPLAPHHRARRRLDYFAGGSPPVVAAAGATGAVGAAGAASGAFAFLTCCAMKSTRSFTSAASLREAAGRGTHRQDFARLCHPRQAPRDPEDVPRRRGGWTSARWRIDLGEVERGPRQRGGSTSVRWRVDLGDMEGRPRRVGRWTSARRRLYLREVQGRRR